MQYACGATRGRQEDVLELLQGVVVQVEAGVSCQVQLLQLGGEVFRKDDLTQLITAQVHTLGEGGRGLTHTHIHTHTHTQGRVYNDVYLHFRA